MGTRADFYVGTGESAEWLGSVAWDGDDWEESPDCALMRATTEDEFRAAVADIAADRDDWTRPEDGWPWPWEDSGTTDCTYYFEAGAVSCDERDDWPDMSERQNVTFGKRSGVIVIGGS